jgi:predicted nucleic acid-binding protein
MANLVVDASVVIKWFVSEPLSVEARSHARVVYTHGTRWDAVPYQGRFLSANSTRALRLSHLFNRLFQ